jgi:hypothetical protein
MTSSDRLPPGLEGKVGIEAVESMMRAQAERERAARSARPKARPKAKAKARPKAAPKSVPIEPPEESNRLTAEQLRTFAGLLSEMPYKAVLTWLEIRGIPEGSRDAVRELFTMDDRERRVCAAAVETLLARHEDALGHQLPWVVLGVTISLGTAARLTIGRRLIAEAAERDKARDEAGQ